MFAALLVVLSAAPMASDDAAERLAAVATWAKTQRKPQLSSKDARALSDCVELPPVKETGCAVPAKLCRLAEGDDGSSGTRTESLSMLLMGQDRDVKPLRVWWIAAYEPKRGECDPPESMSGTETPEFRAQEAIAFRKAHPKEYAKCVARAEKDAQDDAEELSCEVVLLNACRKEAYLTCKSRNLRKGIVALEHLHRFEF